jgi:hypothetical protein
MQAPAILQITWEESLLPEGGSEVVRGTAALIKSTGKDAAGIAFHKKAFAQLGIAGVQFLT